ncbi:glyoxylate/hydroxypyruvate reductase A [Microvirga tunisiensis]|uniref:Glyoxylate/hydroxypyruvate reductase A n=1 Tax=Pannonibacter tanglangensis TaxID=2750084 RepID=A0A7X5F4X0_9HYPH|nr:glyoxylate/hydroxypyruvate reductase A [Pannonibacter sp. XCT-53]NBN79833.1 glyoxylate/hydroxypyruvate reductase A [Pannonibacter sp. XCT-53]
MRPIIPFVTRISAEEQATWHATFRARMPDFDVRPLADLSDADCRDAKVAIVANPEPAELRRLPSLVFVQSLWAGVERLVSELEDQPFAIVRMTDPQLAETMAEAVLTFVLYLHRDGPAYRAQQIRHVWSERPYRPARERRIGVLGLGNLGALAATRLVANGFPVEGWSRTPKAVAGVSCHSGEDGLDRVLSRSDIVVVLLPLTSGTRALLDARRLARLPSGAALINFARGPIVDTEALVAALDDGHLGHAVLDVFAREPLPADDPLWDHPGVTILPHVSAPTTPETATRLVAENLHRFFATGMIPEAVDRDRGY